MSRDILDDSFAHLKDFPEHVLLDIARNGAAMPQYRIAAVEIMMRNGFPKASHPDLVGLVQQLEIEMDGIQMVFDSPIKVAGPGPLTCSVTTATMTTQDIVHLPDTKDEDGLPGSDDSSFRGSPRDDSAERGGAIPGETEPRPRRKRNTGRA